MQISPFRYQRANSPHFSIVSSIFSSVHHQDDRSHMQTNHFSVFWGFRLFFQLIGLAFLVCKYNRVKAGAQMISDWQRIMLHQSSLLEQYREPIGGSNFGGGKYHLRTCILFSNLHNHIFCKHLGSKNNSGNKNIHCHKDYMSWVV